MIKRILLNILFGCLGLVIALLLMEVFIRFAGVTGADGQFSFRGYPLEPYALNVEGLHRVVDSYVENESKATLIYDESAGWAHRPNSISQEGSFTVNAGGLRSQVDYDQYPRHDTLRIAAFGDSFVAGVGVNDDQVWVKRLEVELNRLGMRVETLNFGVGGYGMDQAYIRWQNLGRAYKPDLVLFAFQPENLDRNVNVFRPLYYRRVAVPFSKPRFVLHNDQLALLNVPTLPTAELKSVYSSFESHPLAAYEAHYESHEFVSQWWAASRLASFINALVKSHGGAKLDYGPGSERGELGKAIVDAFAESVKSGEAEFIVVHLPQREHLQNLLDGNVSPFSYLLNHINENYRYVDMVDHLGSQHTEGRFYDATHHYGTEINHLVALTLASEIAECVKNASCRLPRFTDTETLFFHRQE